MFDTKQTIELNIRPASAGGIPQAVSVRWPTDQEWSTRQRARKMIIRRLGRGRTEFVAPAPVQADVDLYKKIAVNGAPELTLAEAQKVLDAMSTTEVTGVEFDGASATVEMETMNGTVHHEMTVPTADQILVFRRTASKSQGLPYGMEEVRVNPDAGAKLYDECGGKSADYDGAIPSIHKDAAVRQVIEAIDYQFRPRKDDENF